MLVPLPLHLEGHFCIAVARQIYQPLVLAEAKKIDELGSPGGPAGASKL